MKQYRKRIYDTVLRHRLEAKGAVLVEGPKWCGKTTTCLQLACCTWHNLISASKTSCLRICSLRCFCKERHRDSSMSGKLHPNCGMLSVSKSINATNSISFSLPAQVCRPALQTLPTQEPAEKIFVLEDMPAWNPNLRSKSAIRTSDTRHFVDPSIAAAALGIGPAGLIKDLETFGLLFESMCVRDFRVYADALDGDVFHFRDRTGLECDAVLHLRDGRYGLIEVKLGGNRLIEEGAANLIKLADKIDTTTMSKPSFLMVATGTGEYSFTRRDGVMVAPIRTLRP